MAPATLHMAKIEPNFTHKTISSCLISLFVFILIFSPLTLFPLGKAYAETPQESLRTDVSINIYEYAIEPSGPILPGKYAFQVRNVGTMAHELIVFKLNPGVTAKDFKKVVGSGGSLAKLGHGKGHMPPTENGTTGNLTVAFEPGNYLLLCFRVDKETGAPHFMIGMLREITISEPMHTFSLVPV